MKFKMLNKNHVSTRFLSILVLSNFILNTTSELFTSYNDMITLAKSQINVTKHLREFFDLQEKNILSAREQIKDFEIIANQAKDDIERFIGNPVNSFLIIKKLSKDLQKFVDTFNSIDKLKEMVNDIKENYLLPTIDDYKGAIIGIQRLEDTYLLNPRDIRNGNLSQKYQSRPLTAFECFEFGRVAYEAQDYYHTIRWMNEALIQHNLEEPKSTANKVDILDYLSYSNARQGNLNLAFEITKQILAIDPTHHNGKANIDYYKRALKEATEKFRGDIGEKNMLKESSNDPFEFKNPRPESALGYERDNYEFLCRENFRLPENRLKKLKCRYLNSSPLLYIAPVKEEQTFDDPPIWLYHDVITEKQIEMMKTLGAPKLKRAIVRSPVTGQYETAEYRISKSGWLSDREDSRLTYLTALVSSITNLSLDTAEEWQIANYGIGGQYEPHFDFARKSEPGDAFDPSIGNRIATWLYYLETPEIGGATVFPRIGARIEAKRRAAAFWYNLLPSGEGDFATRHAACPVLFGTKWVSNKWIHTVGQEFRRPCNLKPEKSEDI